MDDNMGMTNKQFQAFTRLVKFVTKIIFDMVEVDKRKELESELDEILKNILEDN